MNIAGRLRADGDLTISGFVEGRVSAEGKVHVTRTGVVRADITAEAAHIAGQVVGDVTASDGVEIATGGRLEGDVTAPRVLLREGAAFLGQIAMGPMVATSMTAQGAEQRGPEALPEPKPAFQPVISREEESAEAVRARHTTLDADAEEVRAPESQPEPEPEPGPEPGREPEVEAAPEPEPVAPAQSVSRTEEVQRNDEGVVQKETVVEATPQKRVAVRKGQSPEPAPAAPEPQRAAPEATEPDAPADPLKRRVTVRRKV